MTRSKRKPYYTDQQSSKAGAKLAKRQANRKVRAATKAAIKDESTGVADGKQYRKVSESWNIRDWSFHAPKDKKASRK